ncbi:hypothetical protein L596_016116 [Steinernema carpocapsae]|uniref:Uncharacterized protein n=1 Tax=Steinernema carpocapsae TaxID=34508 RepID=A0A4U5NI04_STECR|nr:hypothetical protein L596_016116 [Steinernema carpocapsae]
MIVCVRASIDRELKTSSAKPSDCFVRHHNNHNAQYLLNKEIINDWTSLTTSVASNHKQSTPVIHQKVSFVKMSSFPMMSNARHSANHLTVLKKKIAAEEAAAKTNAYQNLPALPPKFQLVDENKPMEITLLNTSADQWKATRLFLQNTAEQLVQGISKFSNGGGNSH